MTAPTTAPRRFAALRDKYSRPYLFTAGLSMLGDNNEHVLTYWVLWEKFHSPALVGFEVISHWLPFLVLSVPFGALAEKYDCRRLVQIAQGLFMLVSIGWGVLFLTDSLQIWSACVLLVLHGCAGALWGPAEQMLLHDFAEPADLPGAIRMNATFKSLGILSGPIVGAALLFVLGPAWGIFANVLFYLPMTLLMLRTPYTGHSRSGYINTKRVGLRDMVSVLGTVSRDKVLLGLILLAALLATCLGGSLQVAMPDFAQRLGSSEGGVGYSVLLFANGVGGVLGGFLLEATGTLKPNVRVAVVTTALVGVTTTIVALTGSYAVAIIALVIGGFANLAAMSIGQAVVQIRASVEERGRVIGVYSMFGSGMRTGNGLLLAVLGTIFSVSIAVAIGATLLVLSAALIGVMVWRQPDAKKV